MRDPGGYGEDDTKARNVDLTNKHADDHRKSTNERSAGIVAENHTKNRPDTVD